MIKSIPLTKLVQSPRNVRRHGDPAADSELKASIAAHGLLQNLIVRPAARGKFEVEAGERRRCAFHGLELGHSKTMMAAFIVAARGTVRQAVLLGLAATVSHTAIVWIVALGGVYLFQGLSPEGIEPYFQFASRLMIVAVALWMLWRIHHEQSHVHHHHDHGHDHHHAHDGYDHHHDHAMDHDLEHALDLTDAGYQDAHERQHAEDIRRRFAGRNVTTG